MQYVLYVRKNGKPVYISLVDVALQWIDVCSTSNVHSYAHVNQDKNTGLLS